MNACATSALFVMTGSSAMSTVRTISARFRLERHQHGREFRAQAFQHFFKHMVGSDAQKTIADLHRHVAVAEVISSTRKLVRVRAFDMQHLLLLCNDLYSAPVRRRQQIATT